MRVAARSVVRSPTEGDGESGHDGFEAADDPYGPKAEMVGRDGRLAAGAETHGLGDVTLFDRRLENVRHVRCALRIARNGFDHVTAHLALEGEFDVETDAGARKVRRGEIVLIDMTRPMAIAAGDARALTLSVPRAQIERMAGAEGLHGAVISEDRAAMFCGLLASFLRFPDEPAQSDRARVGHVALELLSLALSGRSEGENGRGLSVSDHACRHRARRFVDSNLGAGPDDVGRALGQSRSALYRTFADCGGVARFIRARRLLRMRALLGERGEIRRIGQIAYECGFASDSDASRSFREAFGLTPGEYRTARIGGTAAAERSRVAP